MDSCEALGETLEKGLVYPSLLFYEVGFWQTGTNGSRVHWSNGSVKLTTRWGEILSIEPIQEPLPQEQPTPILNHR